MSNLKKYNIFVLITSFAKLLVELFIPLILFDKGFSVKEILLFLFFKYLFCSLLIPVTVYLGRKISFTKLMIISSFIFSITYVYLNYIKDGVYNLIILAFIFSVYLVFYWLSRHIYALSIIEDKKITDNVSLYSIFGILGGIPATFIGAFILNRFGYIVLTIIVFVLMILSVIPIIKIKDVDISKKISVKEIVSSFPLRNYAFLIVDQFRYIINTLFPLYIYLYIKKEFSYLGIVNIISGIGSVLYIYFLSKVMDKNKKDYLVLSIILIAFIYLIKINLVSSVWFLVITFLEGVFKSSLDAVVLRNTYAYGKNYEPVSYMAFTEFINNSTRSILFLLFFLFNASLKVIIIIDIVFVFVSSLIKFDDGKYGYNKKELV